jgi:hypothetical protein
MKIAGIESATIFADEVLLDDSVNEGSSGGTGLSAKASSAIEGEITP